MAIRILNIKPQCYLLVCFILFLSQCSRTDCYRLRLPLNQDLILSKGAPVILSNGIAGYVDEIKRVDGNYIAEFCLPSALQIPKNSKIYVGYIRILDVYGIKIEQSNEPEFISSKILLQGYQRDTIEVDFPAPDTTFTNKLIDVIIDFNNEQMNRKDSM